MQFKLKIWVGPCGVKEWADKIRAAGYTEVVEGTEHVYVREEGIDCSGAQWNFLVKMVNKYGTDYSLRPKAYWRAVDNPAPANSSPVD